MTNQFTVEVIISKSGFPAYEQVRMRIQARGHCFEVYKSSNTLLQPIQFLSLLFLFISSAIITAKNCLQCLLLTFQKSAIASSNHAIVRERPDIPVPAHLRVCPLQDKRRAY